MGSWVRRMGGLVWPAVFAACVGDSSVVPDSGADATTDVLTFDASDAKDAHADDAPSDAAVRCDPTKAFAAPVLVGAFPGSTFASDEWLSADETTLYAAVSFADGGLPHPLLYEVQRNTPTSPWLTPSMLSLTATGYLARPTLPTTQTEIYYENNNGAVTRLWVATRTSALLAFSMSMAGELAGVSSTSKTDNEGAPFVLPDGSALWFYSTRGGGSAGTDIYYSTYNGTAFTAAVAATTLNTNANETTPTLSEDGLTIYLASTRTGTMGSWDIYMAHRASAADPFPAPQNVSELNSTFDDRPGWISPDLCRMYMTSTRNGGLYRLFVATKAP